MKENRVNQENMSIKMYLHQWLCYNIDVWEVTVHNAIRSRMEPDIVQLNQNGSDQFKYLQCIYQTLLLSGDACMHFYALR